MNRRDRSLPVKYADVEAAAARLAGHAHRTPVPDDRLTAAFRRSGTRRL